MPAPQLTFSNNGGKISSVVGFDYITVKFTSDIAYQQFECRATKEGEPYGVGIGNLVASFSYTPASTQRTFEVYDDYLVHGEGDYRISLFAQSTTADGSAWNDNHGFIALNTTECMRTSDGKEFLCVR